MISGGKATETESGQSLSPLMNLRILGFLKNQWFVYRFFIYFFLRSGVKVRENKKFWGSQVNKPNNLWFLMMIVQLKPEPWKMLVCICYLRRQNTLQMRNTPQPSIVTATDRCRYYLLMADEFRSSHFSTAPTDCFVVDKKKGGVQKKPKLVLSSYYGDYETWSKLGLSQLRYNFQF